MSQYHFSYFIFFKPYWMDSGNIQRRNEFGRCKQFLLKFWRQMTPTISIFSLVKIQSCKKAFTPRLPTDEATKLIHEDTSDDRKMRYAVPLSIFTCHEFVVRQLSFFTRTVSLTEISTKHPQEELWNVIANCQLIPTRWSKCLEHLLVLSWPYAVIFSQEQGKNFSSKETVRAQTKDHNNIQYFWTWCQSFVPNDVPRDFGPLIDLVSFRKATGSEGV